MKRWFRHAALASLALALIAAPAALSLSAGCGGGGGATAADTPSGTPVNEASVSAPTFSPEAGSYNAAQDVAISTATEGATIYYTTDGTDPSASVGTAYGTAIHVAEGTTTIKAIAVKDEASSDISSGAYVIAAASADEFAKTVVSASNSAVFEGVSASGGGIYAAGVIYDADPFDFGNGVSVSGVVDGYDRIIADQLVHIPSQNSIVVKYNASGNAQWGKSVESVDLSPDVGLAPSYFRGVSANDSGIYAVGAISTQYFAEDPERIITEFNFGNGAIAESNRTHEGADGGPSPNPLIVKYDADGNAQWARSAAGSHEAYFFGVSAGADGIYAVGYSASQTLSLDSDLPLGLRTDDLACFSVSDRALIVKYSAEGTVGWAELASHGTAGDCVGSSSLTAVSAFGDSVYAVGNVEGGMFGVCKDDFDNDGTLDMDTSDGDQNANDYDCPSAAALIKYDADDGSVVWARSVLAEAAGSPADIDGVYADGDGVFVVGDLSVAGINYSFQGSSAEQRLDIGQATGRLEGEGTVLFVAKYDVDGNPLWVKLVESDTGGGNESSYMGVFADSSGVYAAGYMEGAGTYSCEDGVAAVGSANTEIDVGVFGTLAPYNIIIAKYDPSSGEAQWARSAESSTAEVLSGLMGVTADDDGVYAAGDFYGAAEYDLGNGLSVTGTTLGINPVVVKMEK